METARRFFEETVLPGLGPGGRRLPDDVVVVFHIEGPGGGSWQVRSHKGLTAVEGVGDGPKDCEVRCEEPVFLDIVRGELTAREAFMSGRVQVVGDIGLVMRMSRIFIGARSG